MLVAEPHGAGIIEIIQPIPVRHGFTATSESARTLSTTGTDAYGRAETIHILLGSMPQNASLLTLQRAASLSRGQTKTIPVAIS